MLRLACLALCSLTFMAICDAPAFADEGDNSVSVGVLGVSLMTLPPATAVTLDATSGDGLAGCVNQPETLVYAHNGAEGLRITMTALPDLLNSPNDISLALTLDDLAPQTCVARGTPLADVALPDSVPPGAGIGDLVWSAHATTDATPSGNYQWTITITSTDM